MAGARSIFQMVITLKDLIAKVYLMEMDFTSGMMKLLMKDSSRMELDKARAH